MVRWMLAKFLDVVLEGSTPSLSELKAIVFSPWFPA